MVDDRLVKLEEARKRLKVLEEQREASYPFWTLWKYFAQKEDWYDDFIHDNRVPWFEIKYAVKPKDQHVSGGAVVTREYGQKLWDERKAILDEIDEKTGLVDALLEDLYCVDDVPLEDIGPYYGGSGSAVFNYLKTKPWFVRRRDRNKALDDIQGIG